MRVSLRYDSADPYAVHLLFPAPSPGEAPVAWSFARDLLVTGLAERAGMGDVRLWPYTSGAGPHIALVLSSPDGCACFEVPRDVLVKFLARSCAVVPLGREAEHLDLDGALHRLVAPG